jgi:hypothetical protein
MGHLSINNHAADIADSPADPDDPEWGTSLPATWREGAILRRF